MKHDELAVPERYIDQPTQPEPAAPRPASWADFSADSLQNDRPVSQSSAQNCSCNCYRHKHTAKSVVTRRNPKHGTVARCEYIGCDCVEYRPVLPKGVRAGNWIVERGK